MIRKLFLFATALAGAALIICPKAEARDDFYIRFAPFYSYARLENATKSTGSAYSLLSSSGFQGQFEMGKYFSEAWSMYLRGMYFLPKYIAPVNRTLERPTTSTYIGSLGTEIRMGDAAIFLEGGYRSLVLVNQITASDYELRLTSLPFAGGGFKLYAYSRFGYELQIEMAGGAGVGKGKNDIDQSEVVLNYFGRLRGQMMFGTSKTTGTTSLKFGGFSHFESRYGLDMELQADGYTNVDQQYTATHIYAGVFLNLVF